MRFVETGGDAGDTSCAARVPGGAHGRGVPPAAGRCDRAGPGRGDRPGGQGRHGRRPDGRRHDRPLVVDVRRGRRRPARWHVHHDRPRRRALRDGRRRAGSTTSGSRVGCDGTVRPARPRRRCGSRERPAAGWSRPGTTGSPTPEHAWPGRSTAGGWRRRSARPSDVGRRGAQPWVSPNPHCSWRNASRSVVAEATSAGTSWNTSANSSNESASSAASRASAVKSRQRLDLTPDLVRRHVDGVAVQLVGLLTCVEQCLLEARPVGARLVDGVLLPVVLGEPLHRRGHLLVTGRVRAGRRSGRAGGGRAAGGGGRAAGGGGAAVVGRVVVVAARTETDGDRRSDQGGQEPRRRRHGLHASRDPPAANARGARRRSDVKTVLT